MKINELDKSGILKNKVLFETAKKTWFFEKIVPTMYFYTYKENEIYFRATHIDGKCPNRFVIEIEKIIVTENRDIQIHDGSKIVIDLDNQEKGSIDGSVCIKYRFPIPGLYFIKFNILDKNGESQIADDEIQVNPSQRTLSGDIGRAWSYEIVDKKETKNPIYHSGKIPILVLDYFSYQITLLTKWLIGLTLVLILVPKVPAKLFKLIFDFFKYVVK